jgi:glycine cleavage system H protein
VTTRTAHEVLVDGFAFRVDRFYDPNTGMWVLQVADGSYRIGLTALTADSYGALAQLSIEAPGRLLSRGEPFGSLEAAKFVGPLIAPMTGTLQAANSAALADPELVLRRPYDDGWLVEITTEPTGAADLLAGTAALTWFAETVARYRRDGLVAE